MPALRKSIVSKCTIVFAFNWKMQRSDLNELYFLGDDMASKRLDFLTLGAEFHLRDIVAVVLFIVGATENNKGLGNDLFRV